MRVRGRGGVGGVLILRCFSYVSLSFWWVWFVWGRFSDGGRSIGHFSGGREWAWHSCLGRFCFIQVLHFLGSACLAGAGTGQIVITRRRFLVMTYLELAMSQLRFNGVVVSGRLFSGGSEFLLCEINVLGSASAWRGGGSFSRF